MRIFEGLDEVAPASFRNAVVTLGTFDGVHRGHQAVLRLAARRARAVGGETVVLTFRHHPRRVLSGREPRLLTSLPRRLALLEAQGADNAVLLDFSPDLAALPAEDFARRVLAARLGAREVVLGHDAAFGSGKTGDAAFLASLGPELGFAVREAPPVLVDGRPASSSRIRALVERGDVAGAGRLLGRPVLLEGTVVRGRAVGRDLGFPTANLDLHHEVRPPTGIYAGRWVGDGPVRDAVVNIGHSPTFMESAAVLVEVHVLDFEDDLYGSVLAVELVERLRDEAKFDSIEALVAAIAADVDRARGILAATPAGKLSDPS